MSVLSLLPEDKRKDSRKESLESVYSSNSRLNLLNKRKRLNPLGDMSSQSVRSKSGDRFVTQRVLSAKTHRVKQLQNQLADAHYHLQELSNENRMLRAIQKKQEIGLQRYENSNAELPQVLNSHSEEMRIQQAKYKQLKAQYKELSQRMKERDSQYQMLKDEHQHLSDLAKDRNLLEREKLQAQVSELSIKVQQQNETISMLQRRIALEAKNFKHQLQNEINKHKDTRADLDLAITNADKLSTIIELKERMLSTAASRSLKSPPKSMSTVNTARPVSKGKTLHDMTRSYVEERNVVDQNIMAKLCENSRNLNSALSHDDDTTMTSSSDTRSRYTRSRTNSLSTHSTQRSTPSNRKNSKESDEMVELAKTVQDGMADLAIFDDDMLKGSSPDEMQRQMEAMKAELMKKIKNQETKKPTSALRRMSTEESIEEQIEQSDEISSGLDERPKSRGRRNSTVSFSSNVNTEETTSTVAVHDIKSGNELELLKVKKENKRENSALEKKLGGKPIEKYCKDIIHDIEKSSKVIEKHVMQFNNSRFDNDTIVEQLQAVDKMNQLVNGRGDQEVMSELNNNFNNLLTDTVFKEVPSAKKRSLSGRRNSKEFRTNLLGDSNLSNQDLLNDLLGKK